MLGFEEVLSIFRSIAKASYNMSSSMSSIIAWIGIILVAIVVVYYIAVGITKAVKAFLHMRVKYLGIFTLLLGVALIAIAMILP